MSSGHLGCRCCTEFGQSGTGGVVINAMLPRRHSLKALLRNKTNDFDQDTMIVIIARATCCRVAVRFLRSLKLKAHGPGAPGTARLSALCISGRFVAPKLGFMRDGPC